MDDFIKLTCTALVLTGLSMAATQSNAAPKGEKCYGIAKAGKNACGGKGTGHSCESHSTVDGHPYDWLIVPKGLCNRIVGGSTTPGANKDS